jgi:general secretion pathway protein G
VQTLRISRRHAARGFTLIELLVVIIILAILAAVVIPRVIGRTEDARQAKAISDISTIDSTLDTYKLDTGNYPSADAGLQSLVTNAENSPKWNGPYLKNGLPLDPWGHPYQYKVPGNNGQDYTVFATSPDGKMFASGQQ